ncbi:exosortase F system-associated membrane protein [Lutibacter sp.]
MKRKVQILLIVLLFLLLIAVRVFIQPYFYDPLIDYFKNDYLQTTIPNLDFSKFFLNVFYRYTLNTIISLAIIYLFFNDFKIIYFSIKFYIIAFVIFGLALFVFLKLDFDYKLIFYARRFLIQPLFVFLLLPAFYYQQLKK